MNRHLKSGISNPFCKSRLALFCNDNPFFDSVDWLETEADFVEKKNFIQALLAEDAAMEESFPFAEEEIQEAPPELTERTLLKRDLRKAAIARIEDAARTEEDFREVVKAWVRHNHSTTMQERRFIESHCKDLCSVI
ncbi:MAG: hypothetical protein ACOCM4_01960 [Acetivibrio ethanolgignens]